MEIFDIIQLENEPETCPRWPRINLEIYTRGRIIVELEWEGDRTSRHHIQEVQDKWPVLLEMYYESNPHQRMASEQEIAVGITKFSWPRTRNYP